MFLKDNFPCKTLCNSGSKHSEDEYLDESHEGDDFDNLEEDEIDECFKDDDIDESVEDDDDEDFLEDNDDNDEYLDVAEDVDLVSEKRNTSERKDSSWP